MWTLWPYTQSDLHCLCTALTAGRVPTTRKTSGARSEAYLQFGPGTLPPHVDCECLWDRRTAGARVYGECDALHTKQMHVNGRTAGGGGSNPPYCQPTAAHCIPPMPPT